MSSKRPFQVDDIAKIQTIGDVKLSPYGRHVAYTLKSTNLKENRYETDLYTISLDGEEPIRITEEGKTGVFDWSPDSKRLAYVLSEKEERQIWVMDRDGKNKRNIGKYDLSNASLGVSIVGETLKWSPDGSCVAFLASLEPVDKDVKIKVITRLMYKSFYGFSDMRRRHIFILPVLGHEPPKQLTFGDYDEHSMCWSPDGSEIAFVSNRTGSDDLNMHTDIYAVNVQTNEIRRITDTVGSMYYPTYSPSGEHIAFTATTRPNTSNESTPEDRHVWVVNRDGSNPVEISEALDRPCGSPPHWISDKEIIFTASDEGRVPIFKVNLEGEISNLRSGNRFHSRLSVSKTGQVAYTWNDPFNPEQLCYMIPAKEDIPLLHLNEFLSDVELSWPEEFDFQTSDGFSIQGWIVKPPGFDPTRKYPTLLNIKGGPSGMRGYSFNTHIQAGPGEGFVQVFINYRGSSGYGQAFTDAVVKDMLGGEYRDNIETLDHVINTYDFVDSNNLGVWGGSYGGYLTNWIITQTNRFKAAVAISSISNLWSQWGASAIPLWLEVEIEGLPWQRKELMMKQSPLFYADKAQTPTLFLHGEMDYDTPIVEAEQMFMALKKMGVETVFVRYADDGHGIRMKPVNQIDALRRAMKWFKDHL